jgi:LmbE family N-acetylglucosaminyl deacetylase
MTTSGKEKEMATARRVLAIGAHPDDVEIGTGATLLKHKSLGDELYVLILTRGEAGAQLPEVRVMEAESAAGYLGAAIRIGDLPDTRVAEKPAIDLIEAVAAEFQPDVAYVHSVHDTHQDHRASAYASRVALRNVRKLYAYQAPSATEDFIPARFTDTTTFMAGKLELTALHKSQAHRCYMDVNHICSVAGYWGVRCGGCATAEAFEVVFDRDYSPQGF